MEAEAECPCQGLEALDLERLPCPRQSYRPAGRPRRGSRLQECRRQGCKRDSAVRSRRYSTRRSGPGRRRGGDGGRGEEHAGPCPQLLEQAFLLVEAPQRRLVGQLLELSRHTVLRLWRRKVSPLATKAYASARAWVEGSAPSPARSAAPTLALSAITPLTSCGARNESRCKIAYFRYSLQHGKADSEAREHR